MASKDGPIKVKATRKGFYGKFRYPDDEFTVRDEKAFSKRWMVKVEPKRGPGRPPKNADEPKSEASEK